MEEIIELLGNNVEALNYDKPNNQWFIHYKKGELDIVKTEDLKEFLENA